MSHIESNVNFNGLCTRLGYALKVHFVALINFHNCLLHYCANVFTLNHLLVELVVISKHVQVRVNAEFAALLCVSVHVQCARTRQITATNNEIHGLNTHES